MPVLLSYLNVVAIIEISKRILRELFAIHMLFQGVEFLTVKPATSPHYPHTNITAHTPSPSSPLSLLLSLSHVHTNSHTHTLLHSLTSPPAYCSAVQTSYTSVWQVILNCSVGRRNRCGAEVHRPHTALCWFVPVSFSLFPSLFSLCPSLPFFCLCFLCLSLQKPCYCTL